MITFASKVKAVGRAALPVTLADSHSTRSIRSSSICAVWGVLTLRFRSSALKDVTQTQKTLWSVKKINAPYPGEELKEAQCFLQSSSLFFIYSPFSGCSELCFGRQHPPSAGAASAVMFPVTRATCVGFFPPPFWWLRTGNVGKEGLQ